MLILLVNMALATALSAQQTGAQEAAGDKILREVQGAFSREDPAGMLRYAAESIEISIRGKGSVYSKSQARYVLRDFFRQHPDGKVSFGRSSGAAGSVFCAGTHRSARGNMSVFLMVRLRNGQWELREVRIEQAPDS